MPNASDIQIIRGGRLLNAPEHKADPADIMVEGDTIRDIGVPGMQAPEDAEVLDATGMLVMPGLVNAHTHGQGSFAKGLGDRWSLELLLNASPWTSANRTHEDKYLATLVTASEMVQKGCTAAYDLDSEFPVPTLEGLEAVGRAYADVGIRAVVAPMTADRLLYEAVPGLLDAIPELHRRRVEKLRAAPSETIVAASRRFLRGWSFDRSRIRLALAPTIPLHCSDDFLVACRDLANEYGVSLHTHLAESKVQAVSGLRRYGKTLTAHLEQLGLLGPNFTGAHCVWLDDDDIRRIADNGASIAHNPGCNLRLGSGVPPVRTMIDCKATVGIGTDGPATSDNQSMFEAMRLASFVSRLQSPNYETWLATDEVMTLTTVGSARMLGFGDDIGRIAPGYKADIVFLDLESVNFVPLNDVTNQIVHCENGSSVKGVLVGGRMILQGGRFTAVDYAKAVWEVEAAMERLRAVNADAKDFALKIQDFVGRYCVDLARQPYHVHRSCGSSDETVKSPRV